MTNVEDEIWKWRKLLDSFEENTLERQCSLTKEKVFLRVTKDEKIMEDNDHLYPEKKHYTQRDKTLKSSFFFFRDKAEFI